MHTIGNQAFSHDECNIFPGLSYNKANNTFLNSLKKNDVEAQVEFTVKEKLWKGLGSPVIDVSVKKNSLLVYVLFGIFAGRFCSVVIRERDKDTKGLGPTLGRDFFSF